MLDGGDAAHGSAGLTAVRILHLLGVAFFLGGQLVLAAAVAPALRSGEEPMRTIARRFGIGSVVALVVIIASGAVMAAEHDRWDDALLQAKLGLLVGVFVLIGLHVLTPYQRVVSLLTLLLTLVIAALGVSLAH